MSYGSFTLLVSYVGTTYNIFFHFSGRSYIFVQNPPSCLLKLTIINGSCQSVFVVRATMAKNNTLDQVAHKLGHEDMEDRDRNHNSSTVLKL